MDVLGAVRSISGTIRDQNALLETPARQVAFWIKAATWWVSAAAILSLLCWRPFALGTVRASLHAIPTDSSNVQGGKTACSCAPMMHPCAGVCCVLCEITGFPEKHRSTQTLGEGPGGGMPGGRLRVRNLVADSPGRAVPRMPSLCRRTPSSCCLVGRHRSTPLQPPKGICDLIANPTQPTNLTRTIILDAALNISLRGAGGRELRWVQADQVEAGLHQGSAAATRGRAY